jgi:hypothetical protein
MGFHGKPRKQKEANTRRGLKVEIFYNRHYYKLQNQISLQIFDGLTQNFVTGSFIRFC